VKADRLELYANGEKIYDEPIVSRAGTVIKADFSLSLPRPKHDAWLVAIASGPGVREPYWPISRPYQPNRGDWDPRLVGSTSPIRLDGDGDGRYSSPAEYAERLVQAHGSDPGKLMAVLGGYDGATAVQAAATCRWKGIDLNAPAFRRAADAAAPQVRHGFVAYRNLLVPPK
jgi:hypothetical protein